MLAKKYNNRVKVTEVTEEPHNKESTATYASQLHVAI
jgi:hypothetical protein